MDHELDVKQELIDLYDAFTHGHMDRREFLDRFTKAAGGIVAAAALLPLIETDPAAAAVIEPDDDRLTTDRVTYSAPDGPVTAYRARPSAGGEMASIIVIHENRGLNAHIEDVTRRAALAGYTGLGLDLLSPVGGTPADANEARGLIGGLDRAVLLRNVAAAMSYLRAQPGAADPIGIVGFCWGGGVVGDVAVAAPDLDAAIVFYGRAPRLADVPDIRARMLMHYASRDDRINATVFPAFIDALKAAGKDFTAHLYEDAQHAFHNDTAQSRYNAAAAMLAWSRSVAFFDETLKG